MDAQAPGAAAERGDGFWREQRVLVVAPHPDDETLGCAGTLARVTAAGGQAYVMVVSAGGITQHGRAADGRGSAFVPGARRIAEFQAAMSLLKVDDVDVLYDDDATHLRLDTLPQRELVDRIGQTSRVSVAAVEPSVLLLPATSFNQDHAAVFRAATAAARPAPGNARHQVPWVLAYDNTSGFWGPRHERFSPTVYVDISAHLETKLEALRLHASQLRPAPFHASPEGVRALAEVYGGQIGVRAAEAYEALRVTL